MNAWTRKQIENPASWVVRHLETGAVVCELFSKQLVDQLNTKKYEAVPILLHLYSLNGSKLPT